MTKVNGFLAQKTKYKSKSLLLLSGTSKGKNLEWKECYVPLKARENTYLAAITYILRQMKIRINELKIIEAYF